MRQILYWSISTVPGNGADLAGILQQSRHNNAIDGVTGLLWSDGLRFLQVFEGPDASMFATWARIQKDIRHTDITVIHDRPIDMAEFGSWTMAHRRVGEAVDVYDVQACRMLAHVSPMISQPFLALITMGELPS